MECLRGPPRSRIRNVSLGDPSRQMVLFSFRNVRKEVVPPIRWQEQTFSLLSPPSFSKKFLSFCFSFLSLSRNRRHRGIAEDGPTLSPPSFPRPPSPFLHLTKGRWEEEEEREERRRKRRRPHRGFGSRLPVEGSLGWGPERGTKNEFVCGVRSCLPSRHARSQRFRLSPALVLVEFPLLPSVETESIPGKAQLRNSEVRSEICGRRTSARTDLRLWSSAFPSIRSDTSTRGQTVRIKRRKRMIRLRMTEVDETLRDEMKGSLHKMASFR